MSVGGILGGGFASAFLAIAPIVNPLGCAVLFTQRTARCPRSQRAFLARRIAINAALVLLAAMWAGTALMALLGVELPALRIAGGLVVAVQAWRMLDSGPESDPDISKVVETTRCDLSDQGVFVPLTIPFTTGPGTLAAAMALGAARPAAWGDALAYSAGTSAAALTVAASVWITYAFADRVLARIGTARAAALARLSAFALLCVAAQILVHGLREAFR
jgi:multiple antibiotic resistance protein